MMKIIIIYFLVILVVACSKDDTSESTQTDLIVGTWRISGSGTVYKDGSSQYYSNGDFCTLKSRYSFNNDGTFKVETFDGSENDCFSTGVLTGTWENQGESYHLKIVTDTSDTPETGEEGDVNIVFPDSDTMRWLEQSASEEVDYSFEEYVRVEE